MYQSHEEDHLSFQNILSVVLPQTDAPNELEQLVLKWWQASSLERWQITPARKALTTQRYNWDIDTSKNSTAYNSKSQRIKF